MLIAANSLLLKLRSSNVDAKLPGGQDGDWLEKKFVNNRPTSDSSKQSQNAVAGKLLLHKMV